MAHFILLYYTWGLKSHVWFESVCFPNLCHFRWIWSTVVFQVLFPLSTTSRFRTYGPETVKWTPFFFSAFSKTTSYSDSTVVGESRYHQRVATHRSCLLLVWCLIIFWERHQLSFPSSPSTCSKEFTLSATHQHPVDYMCPEDPGGFSCFMFTPLLPSILLPTYPNSIGSSGAILIWSASISLSLIPLVYTMMSISTTLTENTKHTLYLSPLSN